MPAFPQQFTSTVSHWQQTDRGPTSLWNHGRDAPLPTEVVDYVIIGAGITGASMGYQLSRAGGAADGKSVVIVDAKDVASCASGRNGGHVPQQTWHMLGYWMAPLSAGGGGLTLEEVVEILMFEQENLELVESIINKEGIYADFKKATRYEVLMSPKAAADNQRLYSLFKSVIDKDPKYMGRKFDVEFFDSPEAAQKLTRVNGALAVNKVVAGSWHPHRGVSALMRLALGSTVSDVKFFSWTPVAALGENADGTISVNCGDRGIITARNVIVGTSAYTHHILPELKSILTGTRIQAGLVVPPATYSGDQALDGTYAIERSTYLIQTPSSGLVFGPYNSAVYRNGLSKASEMYGTEDDSVVTPSWRQWMAEYCKNTFAGWGEETPGFEGLTKMWSGIIDHSLDQLPLVGEVPGRRGVYLAVGFSGQGMALIPNIARGLANQLKTGEWDESVPRAFKITQERLDRIRNEALQVKDYPETG